MGVVMDKTSWSQTRNENAVLAEKATALSMLIERVEVMLQNLPMKVELAVDDGNNSLEFAKHNGIWRLLSCDEDCDEGQLTVAAPIGVKAQAALLLPKLFEDLASEQASMLSDVEHALSTAQLVLDHVESKGK